MNPIAANLKVKAGVASNPSNPAIIFTTRASDKPKRRRIFACVPNNGQCTQQHSKTMTAAR
jgi:hypothetical protein